MEQRFHNKEVSIFLKDIIVSWSGGKDSALALNELLNDQNHRVRGLFSTTSSASGRLPVHEVKKEFIHQQAKEADLPLYEVDIPAGASNEQYETIMRRAFDSFKKQGIETIAYADLLLEDIKAYRDDLLACTGMKGLYPLWKKDTRAAANDFVAKGFRAIVTTIDAEKLPAEKAGKLFDQKFIDSLPEDVDPSGEYGEFHTFVFDGPIFKNPVSVKKGNQFNTFSGKFIHAELK
ncbi:hypothetical protein ACDX78_06385 [Virgibacillus oceani]